MNRVALLPGVGLLLTTACATNAPVRNPPAPVIVQAGAPGQASRTISARDSVDPAGVASSAADVRFMQGMIGHHAQAIEMTALLSSRTQRPDMRLLARRIELSQSDEMAMMRNWLTAHGHAVPDEHAHHAAGATLMPGMLTADEMRQLSEAKGAAFDRLFLEFMIKHHVGALAMVETLMGSAGAAQDTEIYAFASDVEADQRMEIDRMGMMLREMPR